MTDRSIADVARDYVRAGLFVNPVHVTRKPDGKKDVRPVGLWRQTSSDSLADVEAWWGEGGTHRNSGILIDCGKSKLVVIDPDGPEGIRNWLALDPPPPLWVVKTPNDGEHWYYRAHPDHPIGNDQDGKVAPHVDVRGLGGFVIAPPTRDGSGAWVGVTGSGSTLAPSGADWTADRIVPDLVIERMKAKAPPTPATRLTEDLSTTDDPLFAEPERIFTDAQAKAFVQEAYERLAATERGFNGAINNFAMACAHFPWLVDREMCGRMAIKALTERTGWDAPDHDDIRTIDSAYSATEAGRSWTAVEVTGAASTAEPDDTPLDILPPPGQPLAVARELLTRIPRTEGEPHRSWWRGDFYGWTGAHWDIEDLPVIERWLYRETGDAAYLHPVKDDFERRPWAPTKKKIGDLVHALGVGTLQRVADEDKVIACVNGVVDARSRELLAHRPSRFNLFSLPFGFDPDAGAPTWHRFLDDVLPGDQQAKDFLAEWFGYVLSGRTDQQKMAALIGQRRSGKGTIARVLGAMVGRDNVAGLDLNLLPGTFGMEGLVGKALAVSGDVRWQSRNIADAVPILLGVIGEDVVSVHRKNRSNWEGHLGVRFLLMSNETPTFSDRSGALSGRMIFVKFDQSFYGREDVSLTDKLMGELPGILNWALDGLARLDGRGRFTEPESGLAEKESTRRLSDPIGAFLDDWCEIGAEQSITLDHLYLKYQNWCESEGRTRDSTTKEIFARDLRAKVSGLRVERRQVRGMRQQFLYGIGSSALGPHEVV